MDALVEEWEFHQRYGKQRPAAQEETAPQFEQYDPRKPPPRISLGTFKTSDVLSKASEVTPASLCCLFAAHLKF